MKRQILFRAKTLNEGEWVQSMTIANGTVERKKHNLYMEVDADKWKGVDPDTLGQYTGVDDVNGKWIFEGDIVRYFEANDEPTIEVVKIADGAFSPITEVLWMGDGEFQVLGNIHDNPRLLELCNR